MEEEPSTLADKMSVAHIENLAKAIIAEEEKLKQYEDDIAKQFPDAQKHFDSLRDGYIGLEDKRKELKEALAQAKDYDVHEINGRRFSLTKVVRMKVKDIDEVDGEFKQMMEVADEKRAASYFKLYGEPPKGFEDNSYDKINWKEI